jgi:hypothetical protein
MANEYVAVWDRQALPAATAEVGLKAGKEGEVTGAQVTARYVKLNAESVADAQTTVRALFGGSTDIPVIVAIAAWKES